MQPLAPSSSRQQGFREAAAHIYDLARRLLGNEADAEDVASEVLLQVMREPSLAICLERLTRDAARQRPSPSTQSETNGQGQAASGVLLHRIQAAAAELPLLY